jgi:hypothetical protein
MRNALIFGFRPASNGNRIQDYLKSVQASVTASGTSAKAFDAAIKDSAVKSMMKINLFSFTVYLLGLFRIISFLNSFTKTLCCASNVVQEPA